MIAKAAGGGGGEGLNVMGARVCVGRYLRKQQKYAEIIRAIDIRELKSLRFHPKKLLGISNGPVLCSNRVKK